MFGIAISFKLEFRLEAPGFLAVVLRQNADLWKALAKLSSNEEWHKSGRLLVSPIWFVMGEFFLFFL